MPQRVLVQWLPTPDLQMQRSIEIGGKWGSAVQLTAIDVHQPCYAKAAALAKRVPEFEELFLQVGFNGPTRYSESGWDLVGKAVIHHRFETAPERCELIEQAWEMRRADLAEAAFRELERQALRVEIIKQSHIDRLEAQGKKDLEAPPSHPMFSMDAFLANAHAIYPPWYWRLVGAVLVGFQRLGRLFGITKQKQAAYEGPPDLRLRRQ